MGTAPKVAPVDGPPLARLRAVVLDCPDPVTLAAFYRRLVGGELTVHDDEWVTLRDGASVLLAFQRVEDHRPPGWPDGDPPQQFHLDVTVEDVEAAEAAVLAFGATKAPSQPGDPGSGATTVADRWRVYLDPAGHPFCLCWD